MIPKDYVHERNLLKYFVSECKIHVIIEAICSSLLSILKPREKEMEMTLDSHVKGSTKGEFYRGKSLTIK
jgi:hypothetical protein